MAGLADAQVMGIGVYWHFGEAKVMRGICTTGEVGKNGSQVLGWRQGAGAVLLAHHQGPCKAGTETWAPAPRMASGAIFKAH